MTIEIYTHEKDASEDFICIEETNLIISIKNIEYKSASDFSAIWSKLNIAKCLGQPPIDESQSGNMIACVYKNLEGKIKDVIIARGHVIIKDKGSKIVKYSNFSNK
jgi:hypothetical protein